MANQKIKLFDKKTVMQRNKNRLMSCCVKIKKQKSRKYTLSRNIHVSMLDVRYPIFWSRNSGLAFLRLKWLIRERKNERNKKKTNKTKIGSLNTLQRITLHTWIWINSQTIQILNLSWTYSTKIRCHTIHTVVLDKISSDQKRQSLQKHVHISTPDEQNNPNPTRISLK